MGSGCRRAGNTVTSADKAMNRAIYVGPTETYPWSWPGRHPLIYGMTGEYRESGTVSSFRPDGSKTGSFVEREDIYITAEDLTRYCPKV